jgi:predicted HD phosphohydrolase
MPIETKAAPLRRVLLRDALGALWLASGLSACTRAGQSERVPPGPEPLPGDGSAGAGAVPNAMPVAGGAATASEPAQMASGSSLPLADDAGVAEPPSAAGPSADAVRLACPVVTRFAAISDDGPRSSFTVMDAGDQLQWLITGTAAVLYAAQVPDRVLFMLRALDSIQAGYPLSVLQHSLQAATRARRASASDELVLCALCHHLGMVITVEGQSELSAAILRGFVSEDAYRVLRHQAEYQWAHYGDRIGLPTDQRARHAGQAWDALARRFCDEWDCPSYDPGYDTLPLSEFEPLIRTKLGSGSGYLVGVATSTDCLMGGTGS